MSESPQSQAIGDLGESEILAAIFPRLPRSAQQLLGPGDDAAVLAAPDGRYVVTTDMMIHGPDFRLAWSSLRELGWKAAVTNLADVAAMGARPTALVVGLALPQHLQLSDLTDFADGMREACEKLAPGCGVVGGDLSVSPTLTIAVTAFGDLEGRAPVLRSGARAGDIVALAGRAGYAAAGLALLFERGTDSTGTPDPEATASVRASHPELISAQVTPEPPIVLGRAAATAGATSMLDVSDGLLLDAGRIAAASGVRLNLHRDIVTGLGPAGFAHLALTGGEDHALLATFPPDTVLPEGFVRIGEVHSGDSVTVDAKPPVSGTGWDPYLGWNGEAG